MSEAQLERIDGLHVGLLDADELAAFNAACAAGRAYRSYEGAGGLMGLAKVRLRDTATIRPTEEVAPSHNAGEGK